MLKISLKSLNIHTSYEQLKFVKIVVFHEF